MKEESDPGGYDGLQDRHSMAGYGYDKREVFNSGTNFNTGHSILYCNFGTSYVTTAAVCFTFFWKMGYSNENKLFLYQFVNELKINQIFIYLSLSEKLLLSNNRCIKFKHKNNLYN